MVLVLPHFLIQVFVIFMVLKGKVREIVLRCIEFKYNIERYFLSHIFFVTFGLVVLLRQKGRSR